MGFVETYGLVALGVLLSIAWPILRHALPLSRLGITATYWERVKPYVVVGAFSLITALLIVAILGDSADWRTALLAGYSWDATLQRVKG